ncbi:MAG: alpha-amylase family glycosyl hydrolase [Cyclobacteriaceae bacterium]
MKKILLGIIFLMPLVCFSQKTKQQNIDRVEPPNWWVGMKWNKVQVLVHSTDPNFSKLPVSVNYPGVSLAKVNVLDNPKYLALDLVIDASAQPGNVIITFGKNSITWPLSKRRDGNGTSFAQGLTSADLIYLLMPDRFSNGDPSNDRIPGMRDQSLNRDSIFYRHGGDLQGVVNHLDYLQSLGVTALWMTPVVENDMPDRTEHGYAMTSHYKIDPRHGGNTAYKKLSDELHKRGMKLIQDAVYNHAGLYHVDIQDKPVKDWLHEWPAYTNTNYKDQAIMDPYGSKVDKKQMLDGWFTKMMPDLNQNNPYQGNYLIQHAIWSVEEFGVDAWRIDTYIYNDLDFMNECNKALFEEYPSMYMFGETWVQSPLNQAFFTENNLNISWKSNLPGETDFQTNYHGIFPALEKNGDGFWNLHQTLSNDFVYKDPSKMVSFLNNHDTNRALTQVGEDVNKYKLAVSWLLTTRGIPQLYYGEEILMKGKTWPRDGYVRLDFAGGWAGDKKNAFTQEGLTTEEKETQDYLKKLGNFRKNSSAITKGKMMQFIPTNNIYVYFRYDSKQNVMIVLNANTKEMKLSTDRYSEIMSGKTKAKNVMTGEVLNSLSEITLPTMSAVILELE